ncbi:MAG: amino acid adenylation domain-containing protein [Gordonia sp. (in: high G+C Gram-positive bacteria)]
MTLDQHSPTLARHRAIAALTAAQREIWMADQATDDATAYTTALVAHARGPVDIVALTKAIDATLDRAEAARVRVVVQGGQLWQEVIEHDIRCEVIDLRGEPDPESAARHWIDEALLIPYDTSSGPLLRASVLRLSDDHNLAFLSAHHLVLDGTAVGLVLSSALTRYGRRSAAAQAYPAATAEERWALDMLVRSDEEYRNSPAFDDDRRFWLDHVAGAPSAPRLLPRVESVARRAEILPVPLEAEQRRRLYACGRELGVRTAGLLLGGLAGFLYRRTGQHDIVLATPMSGRLTPELRGHIGTMATVLPLRVRLRAGATWRQLAADIDVTLSTAAGHSRFRGEDLRRALNQAGAAPGPLGVGANILPITTRAFSAAGLDARLDILSSGPTGDIDVFFEVDAAARDVAVFFHGPGSQRAEMSAIADEFAAFLRELLDAPDSILGPPLESVLAHPLLPTPGADTDPAAPPLTGTLPGVEEWVLTHDDPAHSNPTSTDPASTDPALESATIFTLPTPPHTQSAQVRAVVDALAAAHPELSLRVERLAPGLWEFIPGPAVGGAALAVVEPARAGERTDLLARLHEAGWSGVPGGVATAWVPGRGHAPGSLVVAAHPLLVDPAGRRILRDDAETAWAAIATNTPLALPAPEDPQELFDAHAARAMAPEVLAHLDHWHALTPLTLLAEPLPEPLITTVTVDPDVFAPVGLTPEAVALATAALALATTGHTPVHPHNPEQSALVLELIRDGRDDLDCGGARSTLALSNGVPIAVGAETDPARMLTAARSALAAMPPGFGLLRHLHPQAGPALAAHPRAFTIAVDDRRGDLELRHAADTRPGLTLILRDGAIDVCLSATPADADATALLSAAGAALTVLAETAADQRHLPLPGNDDLVAAAITDADLRALTQRTGAPLAAVWGLSPLQEGLYFQSVVSGDLDVYNAQFVLTFDRALDPRRLRRALSDLMTDHPPLRSGFTHDGLAAPVQYVLERLAPPLDVTDLRALRGDELAAATDDVIAADRIRPFRLDAPPLWRATLVRRTGGDVLVISRRFLIWDGWSNGVFIGGLLAHYAGTALPVTGEPAFARYLRWLAARDRDAAVAAWTTYLDGYDEPSLLAPGADPVVRGGTRVVRHTLSAAQTQGVSATAQRAGVTLNTVLSAAVLLVTGRWSGRTDVAIGQTVAGRPTDVDGAERAIGMFLNTVPVRAMLTPGATVSEFLRAQQAARLELFDHEWMSLGEIASAVRTPALFDVLMVLQNFIGDDTLGAEHGVTGHRSDDHTHFALTVVLTPGPELAVTVETRTDLLDDVTADGLAADLLVLLTALSAADVDDTPLARLPIAAAEAPQRGRTLDVPELSVSEMLAATAAAHPDAPALVFGERELTFAELDAAINRLARLLLAEGAGPEVVVALAIERSIEMVVALFAVLRTGAAYLPLELVHPAERLRGLVDDARPAVALTAGAGDAELAHIFADGPAPIALRDPAVRQRLDELPAHPLDDSELGRFASDRRDRLDHPAYLIYTSGSTGKPKGVVTGYRGLTNMYLNHEDEIFRPSVELSRFERLTVAHTVSFAFDMSWEELLWLTYGHTVHVCDENLRRDPQALVAYCDRWHVDVVNVTPTYAEYLIGAGLLDTGSGHAPALVLLGGEAVGTGVWDALTQAPHTLGYNLYGPTEYTINTLGGGTTDSATPTVGRPISNTVVHLLDPWLRPVPPGVAGELYVEGDGLARGYHNRPGLTAMSFVAHPAEPGKRLYRTGDLMRRRSDGLLDYLGRTDFQIKVRGYRVEPSEVEAALTEIDGVGLAVVVARGESAATTLAAYLVADGPAPASAQLRRALAGRLPAYMVPSSFTWIDEIPVNVNGKRDIKALPQPQVPLASGTRAGSLLERVLAEIAAETLGLPEVDVDANLFDLGAHSLALMAFADAVRSRLGVTLGVSAVFTDPSIAAIAAILDGEQDAADRLRAPVIGFRAGATDAAPVVVLPPGTGLGWRFGQLLPHLATHRALYAVQAPQISGAPVPQDLAAAVSYFADRVCDAVPTGPVVLAGWSFGGSLAPAVATELVDRGRSVESLVLLDAFASSPPEYHAYLDTLSPDASALGALGVAVAPERAATLTRDEAIALIYAGDSIFAGLDADLIGAILDSSSWSLEIMRQLRAPQTPVTSPVLFIEAQPAASLATWGETLGAYRHLTAPWTHGELLAPDAIAGWGPTLRTFLDPEEINP